MARIDAMELSDIGSPDWETAKQRYPESSQKRQQDVEAAGAIKWSSVTSDKENEYVAGEVSVQAISNCLLEPY